MQKTEKALLASIVLISAISIVGWCFDLLILTRISSSFIPMAPLTAILFIFLSVAYWFSLKATKQRFYQNAGKAFIYLTLLILSILLVDVLFSLHIDLERIFVSNPAVFLGTPIARISPTTGVLFYIVCFSYLLFLKIDIEIYRKASVILSMVLVVISFVFLIAYVENIPIGYNSNTIPMALPTALCFLLICIVQLKLINFQIWPFHYFVGKSILSRLLRYSIPTFLAFILLHIFIESHLIHNRTNNLTSFVLLIIFIPVILIVIFKLAKSFETDLQLANQKLTESEELHRSMISNLIEGFCSVTLDGKLLNHNMRFAEIIGLDPNNLHLDLNLPDFWQNPKDRERYLDAFNKKGFIKDYTAHVKDINGKPGVIRLSSQLIKDSQGKPLRIDGVIQVISETYYLKEELIEAHEKIEAIVTNNEEIIYFINENGIFEISEGKGLEKLGIKPGEAVGLSVFELYKNYPIIIENFKKANAGEKVTFEVQFDNNFYKVVYIPHYNTKNKNQKYAILGMSINITEQKNREIELQQAQRKAEESEELQRNMIHNLLEGFYSASLDGKLLNHNLKFSELLGLDTSKSHIGLNLPDFWQNPKDREHYLEVFKQNGIVKDYIARAKKANGELLVVRIGSQLINDSQGNPLRIDGVFQDITEKQILRENLKESEKSYKALFNTIGDAIYIQDMEARFIDINEGAINLYGHDTSEIIGHTPEYLSAPGLNNLTDIDEYFNKAKEGIPQMFNFWGKRKNGDIFPSIVRQFKGTYFGNEVIISLCTDITNIKKQEAELREALQNARESNSQKLAMLNAIPDLVFRIDEKGIFKDFKADVNDLYYKETSIIGKKHSELLPGDIVELLDNYIKRTLEEDSTQTFEYSLEMPTIGICEYEARMTKSGTNEVTVLVRDISEINKNKRELITAKEKAEESDHLKSAFLANMSHEIRTPISGVIGFTNLLKKTELKIKQQEYVDIIEKSGVRLLNIINNIMDISKIEVNQISLVKRETSTKEIIHFLHAFFVQETNDKGLNLNIEWHSENENFFFITDVEKIYSILTNLIKNAIKNTEQGTITFGYNLKPDELNSDLQHLGFFVKDTGCGIPPERVNAIWERFVQVDLTDKKALQGAGLGLTISKAYVELLGGKIWVETEENKGSTFYFNIPVENKGPEITEIKTVNFDNAKTVTKKLNKILFAEDDEGLAFLLEETLDAYCDSLIICTNGQEAVEACKIHDDIDLIFMDIRMPEMDGNEATKEIRKFNPEVIIIAQTAFAYSEDLNDKMNAGFNDSILKPVNESKVEELINKYFNR